MTSVHPYIVCPCLPHFASNIPSPLCTPTRTSPIAVPGTHRLNYMLTLTETFFALPVNDLSLSPSVYLSLSLSPSPSFLSQGNLPVSTSLPEIHPFNFAEKARAAAVHNGTAPQRCDNGPSRSRLLRRAGRARRGGNARAGRTPCQHATELIQIPTATDLY